jgi:hypothetical protein
MQQFFLEKMVQSCLLKIGLSSERQQGSQFFVDGEMWENTAFCGFS